MLKDLTQDYLKSILSYDPETGIFTWIKSLSRSTSVGSIAGTISKRGYYLIKIQGKRYFLHRLVWLYIHGVMPKHDIDHIDRNPSNNRISNLRECNASENGMNRAKQSNNKSGFKGVYWHKRDKLWIASININRKKTYLGGFVNIEDAVKEYRESANKHHGEFSRY